MGYMYLPLPNCKPSRPPPPPAATARNEAAKRMTTASPPTAFSQATQLRIMSSQIDLDAQPYDLVRVLAAHGLRSC